jgi:hypothetical protein
VELCDLKTPREVDPREGMGSGCHRFRRGRALGALSQDTTHQACCVQFVKRKPRLDEKLSRKRSILKAEPLFGEVTPRSITSA